MQVENLNASKLDLVMSCSVIYFYLFSFVSFWCFLLSYFKLNSGNMKWIKLFLNIIKLSFSSYSNTQISDEELEGMPLKSTSHNCDLISTGQQ